jgi:hypothetical protein
VNDSAVLLASGLVWPVAVVLVSFMLLASQRKAIAGLIGRIKSLKYPGGEVQAAGAVPETGADTMLALVDTLSRNLSERSEREGLIVTEVTEAVADVTIENREPLADFEPLPVEEVTSLVMLRAKLGNLLSELAVPPPPGGFGPVSATIDTLVGRGVLDAAQAQALRDAVDISDQAARGAVVPRRVAIAVENSGSAILEQLALLRTVAAARFEDHVLDSLQQQIPSQWSLDIDRSILSTSDPVRLQVGLQELGQRHARVDALVTAADRAAVVEIRSRLQPGASGQIEAVRAWLGALPSELPVLLIMLGDALTARELKSISNGREGPVEILQWDRYAASLITTLRGLLSGPGALAPEAGLVPGARPAP